MKKYKIIILLFCLILLSGCTIDYNITIDNEIIETINIKEYESETNTKEVILDLYNSYFPVYLNEYSLNFIDDIPISEIVYYTKSNIFIDNNTYNYSLNYKHKNLNDYQNTQFWNYLLTNNYIDETDNIITIWAGYGNKLFNIDNHVTNLNIKITTSLKVLENNADKIEGNTYIWEYNKDNYYKKSLSLKLEKESKDDEETNPSVEKEPDNNDNTLKERSNNQNNLILILSIFGGFLLILIVILKIFK